MSHLELPDRRRFRPEVSRDGSAARLLRGRDHELERIVRMLDDTEAGRGGVVLLQGPMGSGKSAMLELARTWAAERGFSIAAGAGDELGRLVPLGPLLAALGGTPSEPVVGLGTAPGDLADLRLWLIERLRDRLETRATQSPVLVTLDDLQWADPTTLFALRALPPELTSYPLLWMLARRGEEGGAGVDKLFLPLGGRPAVHLQLQPLTRQSVSDVVADTIGATPSVDLLAVTERAGGSPLLVIELVEGMRDEGTIAVEDGVIVLTSERLPRRVQAIVAQRLAWLAPQTRQLLEVSALLGRSFLLEDAADLLGKSPGQLLWALEEALDAGVIRSAMDMLAFQHELVRQAVIEAIPEAVRLALHHQAGEMLLARGGSAIPAATHLLKGARRGDLHALAGMDRAVNELLRSSPHSAAELAVRALELTGAEDPERLIRVETAVDVLVAARRLAEAADLAQVSLAGPLPPEPAARLRCALGWILIHHGDPGAAVMEAEIVLRQPGLAARTHSAAELTRLMGLLALGDLSGASRPAKAILAAGDQFDNAAVVGAQTVLSYAAWDEGRLSDGMQQIHEAIRSRSVTPNEIQRVHPRLRLARMLQAIARFDEAEAAVQSADGVIREQGDSAAAAASPLSLAEVKLAAGQVDDAFASAQASLAIANEIGTRIYLPHALSVLAAVELRRGRIGSAAEFLDGYRRGLPDGLPLTSPERRSWMEIQLAVAKNDEYEAAGLLAGLCAELPVHKLPIAEEPAMASWLTRFALKTGEAAHAAAVVAAAEDLADANPGFATVTAAAAHARALLDQDAEAVGAAALGQPDPWASASALEDRGTLLGLGQRVRKAAVESLESALDAYQSIGAVRDVARVRGRLRRLGVRKRHWRRADRPASGWESLTDTEWIVADLVAQGLTNRQVASQRFLSAHTVNSHLRAVFRKLEISSRVELARLWTLRGSRDDSPHIT